MRFHFIYTGNMRFGGEAAENRSEPLGGIEQCVLYLAEALARRDHAVSVAGAGLAGRSAGITWYADKRGLPTAADAVVVTSVASALDDASPLLAGGALPIVWFHNEAWIVREIRRGHFGALRRWRPLGVLLGERHRKVVSRLLPLSNRVVIPHGLPPALLAQPAPDGPRSPLALFTSQPYRGLSFVIDAWLANVSPKCPQARLEAFVAPHDLERYRVQAGTEGETGIRLRPRIRNAEMPATLASARMLLCPGHISETFCLAAAEAQAMGLPVITRGIGSLAERVTDNVDGLVRPESKSFGAAILRLLQDDALWRRLQVGAVQRARKLTWDVAAEKWEALVATWKHVKSVK